MNPPKVIWLQIGEDVLIKHVSDWYNLVEITWCVDQINENDIRYVLDEDDFQNRKEWKQAQEDFIR